MDKPIVVSVAVGVLLVITANWSYQHGVQDGQARAAICPGSPVVIHHNHQTGITSCSYTRESLYGRTIYRRTALFDLPPNADVTGLAPRKDKQ